MKKINNHPNLCLNNLFIKSICFFIFIFFIIMGDSVAKDNLNKNKIICLNCHNIEGKNFLHTSHRDIKSKKKIVCDICHKHKKEKKHLQTKKSKFITNPAKLTTKASNKICLNCHMYKQKLTKNTLYISSKNWNFSIHKLANLSCISCHNVMVEDFEKNLKKETNELCFSCHPKEKMEFSQLSHHPIKENQLKCTDCHNPHYSSQNFLLNKPKNELCFLCHKDKEGPFIFEHSANDDVIGEGCLTCHNAHSSNQQNLLKSYGRGICIQCHTDMPNDIGDFGNTAIHYPGSSCVQCHTDIHGSNKNPFFIN